MKVKTQKKNKGMTLIEITLVIAILLSLIAILFLGISAYKKGADRSKCILTASSMEKLIISHGNMYDYEPGDTTPAGILWDSNFQYLSEEPNCPASSSSNYTYTNTMPTGVSGTDPYATCGFDSTLHPYEPYD